MSTLEVQGNTILDSVINAIVEKFPDIPVYDETINEGIEYPYFMVYCEDFSEQKLMRKNYLQTFIISVLYQYKELPETSYYNFNEVSYQISEVLDEIILPNGDLLRGYNKHYYPQYQKFEYYINYDIKVAKEKDNIPKQMTRKVNVYKK